MIDSTNLNSAFVSGVQGLQRASDGITNASANIAQRSVQTSSETNTDSSSAVPQSNTSLTDDIVSLEVNSINAQASARVIEVADETIGRLIDTTA